MLLSSNNVYQMYLRLILKKNEGDNNNIPVDFQKKSREEKQLFVKHKLIL